MTATTTLVLGGAGSGKSRYAEGLFTSDAVYLATARAEDDEMRARIDAHRARRGAAWRTIEEPLELAALLPDLDAPVLVECLTLWLSNLMEAGRDIGAETTRLIAALARRRVPTVLVANEVGFGTVPEHPLARDFRDRAGLLNQALAAASDRVVLVVAGLPLALKGTP